MEDKVNPLKKYICIPLPGPIYYSLFFTRFENYKKYRRNAIYIPPPPTGPYPPISNVYISIYAYHRGRGKRTKGEQNKAQPVENHSQVEGVTNLQQAPNLP